MNETKSLFIIKKYHSILRAAIIVEAVNFIVSLTDGVVAGNAIGEEAFAAIGLLAPFLSVSTFISSIVNTGTVLNFSYQVGKIDKRRANEFFSQGLILSLLTGFIYALVLLLMGSVIISGITNDIGIGQFLKDYYYIILIFFFLQPVSFLLDNLLVADGGENLSIVANITLIVSNIAGSVIFVRFWDIKGIAIASVLSKVLFILIVCFHFSSKKNTLRFVRHWKTSDLILIVKSGIVKASAYGLEAILTFSINLFAILFFDEETLVVLVVVERFLGLMTLFIGLSMACQPILGTLRGENNTKAQKQLIKTALRDIVLVSMILTLLMILLAPVITLLFGIAEGNTGDMTILALRIVSSTLILQAVLVLFFIYYVAINKQRLAFVICLVKNFISPVIIAVVLSVILGSEIGIWIGLAIAPVLALFVSSLIVLLKYGQKSFPFLIPEDPEQKIFIYDFIVSSDNAVKMAECVETILNQNSNPRNQCVIAGMITEELIMLIMDKNKNSQKPVRAECTLITLPDGVKLILRDSGVIFNLTDTDSSLGSFRQYIVSNLMLKQENKLYMTTTGYNRNEFYFSR